MPAILNPYLSFRDNAREAMNFYQSVFGGELTISTFGEFQPEETGADLSGEHGQLDPDKVMHAMLVAGSGLVLMGADTPPGMPYTQGSSISVSLSGDDESELRAYWDRLADGAAVAVPLEKAPWGDTFGMLTDRFGTAWLVNITGSAEGDGGAGDGGEAPGA
ncbi:VOC family protein [Sinomonas halotolerans]|uniref:VOC family protein n=1 Tax=Sinomonas halotolerans TaxID=1644133 RepID=A0ABU9WYN5_9MICC